MLGKYHFVGSVGVSSRKGVGGDLLTGCIVDDRRELCKSIRLAWFAARCRRLATTRDIIALGSLLLVLATTEFVRVATATESPNNHQQDQLHPSLLVDTKHWIRTTKFGEQDNWHSRLRPCTLLERIAIDENDSVISLDDALDNWFGSLESSSIQQLVLASNGVLLLEEDTTEAEEAYLDKFIAHSGDCFDSASQPEYLVDKHWLRFEPNSDLLSWFNAANWRSELNQDIAELVPDSHLVPCTDDVVVFGGRHRSGKWSLVEMYVHPSVQPFKVNFRPSEQMMMTMADKANKPKSGQNQPVASGRKMDSLLVSRLKIGDKSYTQDELNQLVRLYGDSLFDFNDAKSIFNSGTSNQSGSDGDYFSTTNSDESMQRTLTIDESSIEATDVEQKLCLDEAGCLCGNEQANLMEIICSFNQAPELDDMLCLDPIQSAGYCNRICAATILINMTPAKFSERFLANLLNKLLVGELKDVTLPSPDYFGNHIFVAHRRIDHTRYEITLRLVPTDNDVYGEILGRDLEFAELVRQQLDRAAIKSFYGIKTIHVKASVLWRRDNRGTIFWLAFVTTLSLSVALFVVYDDYLTNIIVSRANLVGFNLFDSSLGSTEVSYMNNEELNMISTHQSIGPECDDRTKVDNYLEHNDLKQEFSMIELDACSQTDSTYGLLKD